MERSNLRPPPSPLCFAILSDIRHLQAMAHADRSGELTMHDLQPTVPPRFLRTLDAAHYLGLSPRTLEKHRTYGTGPNFRKLGGRVVYAIDDLQDWADLGLRMSTSDPGHGDVRPAKAVALRHATTRHR